MSQSTDEHAMHVPLYLMVAGLGRLSVLQPSSISKARCGKATSWWTSRMLGIMATFIVGTFSCSFSISSTTLSANTSSKVASSMPSLMDGWSWSTNGPTSTRELGFSLSQYSMMALSGS